MREVTTLILFLITFCACAQTDRCGLVTDKYQVKFESWISSRRAVATAQETPTVYRIPVVVHILHHGDSLGNGYNFPQDRIINQIKTLNEDFRRQEGTPGFNNHPKGGDVLVEFALAQTDPDGDPTNGIVRVDMTTVNPGSNTGDIITLCSRYSYWDPDRYLNVWCMDIGLPPGLFLGSSRFPTTDLEGLDNQGPQPDGDGVFINALNFGSGDTLTDPHYNLGRTLTHEVGHFLGLLHTWGSINNSRQCDAYSDHCDDTPPTPVATEGCPAVGPVACDGRRVMIENYMDGTYDACMNIFTHDQIARMRTVLENSPHRKSLTASPTINRPLITGVDDAKSVISLYPNPATDKVYVSLGQGKGNVVITAYSLLGQVLFEEKKMDENRRIDIYLQGIHEKMIIVVIETEGKVGRYLLEVR